MNKQDLIDFEKEVAAIYTTGKIRGPIHLRDGNEDSLINIFQTKIGPEDYIFSTWANHLHALLHNIPKEKVMARIIAGESMAMNFPEHKFYTSAIVGGCCPIAVGTAYALKKQGKFQMVHIFIGDMTFYTGIAQECIRYSINFDLPIHWIIEDNGKSVSTPTQQVWGNENTEERINSLKGEMYFKKCREMQLSYYKFNSTYPHSGTGIFVSF